MYTFFATVIIASMGMSIPSMADSRDDAAIQEFFDSIRINDVYDCHILYPQYALPSAPRQFQINVLGPGAYNEDIHYQLTETNANASVIFEQSGTPKRLHYSFYHRGNEAAIFFHGAPYGEESGGNFTVEGELLDDEFSMTFTRDYLNIDHYSCHRI